MSYTTISFNLSNPNGKIVVGQTVIRDGLILSTFSDPNLARQLYEYDLKEGEDVSFNEKHNAYVKKYNGMKKAEIVRLFKLELSKAGGKLVK
jgi:hypothetical protein|tara:strand:+ start:2914 stop:3189 length:276 start_codon:yes stop_codon:yes gene_type:complete